MSDPTPTRWRMVILDNPHQDEVTADGRKVWVNRGGRCIGRICVVSTDILTQTSPANPEDPMAGEFDVDVPEWPVFVRRMREEWGVNLDASWCPPWARMSAP